MKLKLIAILIFVSCTYLSLARLDNTYFWDDEAQTGIIARNLLSTGRLTGWDGRNLLAIRNGATLDKNLRSSYPPLPFLVTATSFVAFGPSTWAGRLPFVIAGLTGLSIFAFVLRYDFGTMVVLIIPGTPKVLNGIKLCFLVIVVGKKARIMWNLTRLLRE